MTGASARKGRSATQKTSTAAHDLKPEHSNASPATSSQPTSHTNGAGVSETAPPPSGVQEVPRAKWKPVSAAQALGANMVCESSLTCHFGVWAPGASACFVEINASPSAAAPQKFKMVKDALGTNDGVFACQLADVPYGTSYHLVLTTAEGNEVLRRDPYARQADFESELCYVVNPAYGWASFQPPNKAEMNIYEVHVGTFSDDTQQSKFLSTIPRLQHIKNLGFNAVEFLPVIEFGGLWGYNPRTLMTPHGKYGTPEDLKKLVNETHKAGLAVIFDMVLTHGSTNRNCLWNYDSENSRKGGIYFEGGSDSEWGSRFNFGRKEIREMVEAAAQRFVTEYNADGIRIDAAQYLPKEVLQNIIRAVHQKNEECFVIAEMTPEDPRVCDELGADAVWIHASYYDMIKLMRNRESEHHMALLKGIINGHSGFKRSYNAVNYVLGSHDQCGNRNPDGRRNDERIGRYLVDQLGGRDNWHARAQCRMWMALQAFSRPVPMIFMGTELMQGEWWHTDRPVNWQLAANDVHAKGMMKLVCDCNKLRASKKGLTLEGTVVFCHENPQDRVIGFTRDDILIVVNMGEGQWDHLNYAVSTSLPSGSTLWQAFNSQDEAYGGWAGSWSAAQDAKECLKTSEDGALKITLPKWSVVAFVVASK